MGDVKEPETKVDETVEEQVEKVVEEVETKAFATVDDVTNIVSSALEKLEDSLFKKIQSENLTAPVVVQKEVVKEEPKETKPLFL